MARTNEGLGSFSKRGATAALVALMLAILTPYSASADNITTWSVNVYVSATPGGNANSTPPYAPIGGDESYSSNYQISNIPAGGQINEGTGCCATFDPVPSQPSLTSVTLGITSSNPSNPPGPTIANANAYGNLATGSLGVSSSTNIYGVDGGHSTSEALMEDTLTFNVPDATSSTVTDIGVQWTVSGGLSSSPASETEPSGESELLSGLYFTGGAGSPVANATTEWESDAGVLSNADGTGASGSGWESSTVVSNTANSVVIDGVLALTGQDPTLPLQLFLECGSDNNASCDYYDTESISFTLPAGVTYTSASGVFLTQPSSATPEPASLLLFGTGLMALAGPARRRKQAARYKRRVVF